MKTIRRGLRAFGHFWWDFLIGDAPELFAATVAVVVLALLLCHHGQVAYIVIPLATVLMLVASTLRAARRSEGKS
jgi:4-hydroxybenzoate polyprenyltransferase